MQDDLDRKLQSLFNEQDEALPEEPFLGNMLKLLEKHQARRIWRQRLALAPALACCVLLSPLLVRGSELLSEGLNLLFNATGEFMATPTGMILAVLCAMPILFLNRKLIL